MSRPTIRAFVMDDVYAPEPETDTTCRHTRTGRPFCIAVIPTKVGIQGWGGGWVPVSTGTTGGGAPTLKQGGVTQRSPKAGIQGPAGGLPSRRGSAQEGATVDDRTKDHHVPSYPRRRVSRDRRGAFDQRRGSAQEGATVNDRTKDHHVPSYPRRRVSRGRRGAFDQRRGSAQEGATVDDRTKDHHVPSYPRRWVSRDRRGAFDQRRGSAQEGAAVDDRTKDHHVPSYPRRRVSRGRRGAFRHAEARLKRERL